TTLAWNPWKKLRIPHRLLGTKLACALHDWLVARALERMAGKVDVVHLWPLGALQTIRVAKELGIPSLLERPNAHTRLAYEVVEKECQRLGISMPKGHEHAFKPDWLEREEKEFEEADKLLCPSDFVARTFKDYGYRSEKLARHQYGYDDKVYYPDPRPRERKKGLTMLFVGGCTPRKGLHYALDAWLHSSAHKEGTFLIAGEFIPGYAELLAKLLSHPSVKVLGHRKDVPDLMRSADIFVLPTIEEGSALVTYEARACGCVLLVSDASGAICTSWENALVHRVGDVAELTGQIDALEADRELLERLRTSSLSTVDKITWQRAGIRLCEIYNGVARQR
ncbi:MAG: glycosyltransferase family 4 protein, partial [candidate division WOR-3 bacterium]